MNVVTLVGNVGQDPSIHTTHSGKKVVNLSLATRGWRKEDGPDWHRIVAWGKTADILEQYVRKGSKLAVQGRIQVRPWTTQKGENRTSVEIVASEVELLDKREERQPLAEPQGMPTHTDDLDDDIPF